MNKNILILLLVLFSISLSANADTPWAEPNIKGENSLWINNSIECLACSGDDSGWSDPSAFQAEVDEGGWNDIECINCAGDSGWNDADDTPWQDISAEDPWNVKN